MHQIIIPKRNSKEKQPKHVIKRGIDANNWSYVNNDNNGRNVNNDSNWNDMGKSPLPAGVVRVIINATDPKYNTRVFLRKYQNDVKSLKTVWCRLENVPLKCVEFFCKNQSLPDHQSLSHIEESYPGIIDIVCVPSTKGLVRILVTLLDETSMPKTDPLIFQRFSEDPIQPVKLDVARALSVESSMVILTCNGVLVGSSDTVGHLKEKWPGIIDLKAQVQTSREVGVQPDIVKSLEMGSQTEFSSKKKRDQMFNTKSIHVRVGSIVTIHVVNPSDTLGMIVEEMRSTNLLMSVCDVTINGTSLWCPNWMERRIEDCQLLDGQELVFKVKKQVAHVELYTPPSLTPQEWTVDVPLKASSWASILSRVPELSKANEDSDLVVVQNGLYFLRNGLWRRAIHSLNVQTTKKGFYAEGDGEPVEEFEGDQFICELLTDYSGIRGATGLAPILTVFTRAEVLRAAHGEDSQLHPAGFGTLFDQRALLLFRGLRHRCEADRTDHLFLLLAGRPAYCNLSDGKVREDVEYMAKSCQSRWTHVFIILFEGDVLPRWPIPFGRHVRLLRRLGMDTQVACDRRIWRHTPGPRPTCSDWTRPTEVDQFLHSVSTRIR